MSDVMTLNKGQEEAAQGFFKFLMEKDKNELVISGAGGTGKTYLMGYLIDKIIPRYLDTCKLLGIQPKYYNVYMTATTNKAAEVLGTNTKKETSTIHSLLGINVIDDYESGKTKLKKGKKWNVIHDSIIFIDECSMIDSELFKFIHEGTNNCKIVYVGDHCQLAPVAEPLSPVFKKDFPFFELTEPMRNSKQQALMNVCTQLRETVETGVFKPISLVPGIIDLLNDEEMEKEITKEFKDPTLDKKILCYRNSKVIDYNGYIQEDLRNNRIYEINEYYVNNNAVKITDINCKQVVLPVEDEIKILNIADNYKITSVFIAKDINLPCYAARILSLSTGHIFNVWLPVNIQEIYSLMKYFAKQKDWVHYFYVKDTFLDLRPKDASTVHKAQGSTYETVYIDLGDLSTCRIPDMAARLLYVAFTRASKRIVLYGKLKEKFGGINA